MSLHLPARRALQAAASTPLRPITTATLCVPLQSLSRGASTTTTLQLTQSRTFFGWLRGRKKDERDIAKEVVPPTKEETDAMRKKLSTPKMGGSIFSDELGGGRIWGGHDERLRANPLDRPCSSVEPCKRVCAHGNAAAVTTLNCGPLKMVARLVKRRLDPWDKETRAERIARTERQHVHRSPLLITSTKKLMHIARQVAGKPLDEAAVQMRFSRKKFARDVGVQIDAARDEAVVMAGMGLSSSSSSPAAAAADGANEGFKPVKFKNKDGKWITVDDPSRLYIDQAWVNRGPFLFHGFHYSGRGRSHAMWTRTSNINFIVKEEKTRLREHQEREAKKARRKPWVHLPNRPVTTQRQHYSW
ncbi:mitochondrial large ribosomal subunit [Magnaporthiopsis poae ATCC 64411]|uniref:Mitochondrial large ribosomal subunit n=1 Tax=Magnaporthiopsis poae (strain ATCC 64411 / 73-15) TaxID=644358 RepID=A0A0C4DS98_MAGP6|nr:mitochondrial large ribosomal subunit [Magnaporthiopsis poae ATCC 64411]